MPLAIATAWLCIITRLVIDMTEVACARALLPFSRVGRGGSVARDRVTGHGDGEIQIRVRVRHVNLEVVADTVAVAVAIADAVGRGAVLPFPIPIVQVRH